MMQNFRTAALALCVALLGVSFAGFSSGNVPTGLDPPDISTVVLDVIDVPATATLSVAQMDFNDTQLELHKFTGAEYELGAQHAAMSIRTWQRNVRGSSIEPPNTRFLSDLPLHLRRAGDETSRLPRVV